MYTSLRNTTKSPNNRKRLLERYLPPIPDDHVIKWIESLSLKGSFVLDPFGAAPFMSARIALSGNCVLIAANNPILRLLIELAANSPTKAQFRTILSTLAALRVRNERVELHIQSLYQTTCPTCEREIFAEAYVWERDAGQPFARIIRCDYCDLYGEFPITSADILRAAQYSATGLHHARALGRIAPPNDPDRIHVEEALNVYPPRAVYALLTLVNKLDQLDLSPQQSRILMAIFLNAFDKANTLWPHPIARERPKQLTIPPTYLENNIWMALETAVDYWESDNYSIPITYWPDLPPKSGGICLYEGRVKDLADQVTEIEFSLVITTFPRPNQAFWSLSALWAGWLWGHEAVEHFKPVLRRRRYDWAWHSTATHAAIQSLIPVLTENATFYGFVGEAEPGFISAVTIAAEQAQLRLKDILVYSEKKLADIQWQIHQEDERKVFSEINRFAAINNAARNFLHAKGEPSRYLQLHSAILSSLGRQGLLNTKDAPSESYNHLQQELQEILSYQNKFLRYGGSSKSLDVGRWWLSNELDLIQPLSDRVEIAVVQHLIMHPNSSFTDVETALINLCAGEEYSGQLIPDSSFIAECLESYGENTGLGWQLKDQDKPSIRRQEIASMLGIISDLGDKLGYQVQLLEDEIHACVWLNDLGEHRYAFYISASALLGKFLLKMDPSPARGVIVLPGGRANLVMYKLSRDPRLQEISDLRWSFIKYRHARQLANSSSLTKDNLDSQLVLDPLTYSETQLRMF